MRRILTMGLIMAAGTIPAATIVHYTFDDRETGETLPHGATIVNAANPGVHDAIVYGLSNQFIADGSSAMPRTTNGLAAICRVYDPVSGVKAASVDRAIRFPHVKASGSHASQLEIANDAALRPEAFTVELFMRWVPGESANDTWNLLAVQPAFMPCANADAWGFRLVGGCPIARFTPPQTFKANVNATGNIEVGSGVTVTDGRWHHVAFTAKPNAADATKTDVAVYVDYEVRRTTTLAFRPQFSAEASCPVWIGGDRQTPVPYTGELGEFRISNEALEPSRFLKFKSAVPIDPDTVIQYDFTDTGFGFGNYVVNMADPGVMDGLIESKTVTPYGTVPVVTNDLPVARLHNGLEGDLWFDTGCSFYNNFTAGSTTSGGYVHVAPVDDWFSKTNFTIECFYKSDGLVGQYTPLVRRPGGVNVQLNIGFGSNPGYLYGAVCKNGATSISGQATFQEPDVRTDDGQWHHAAFAVSQSPTNALVRLYRDYRLVKYVTLATNLVPTADKDLNFMGIYNGNSFNGFMCAARVTLRALEPREFLTGFHAPAGDTLVHLRFENGNLRNTAVGEPADAPTTGAAATGGNAPTFVATVPRSRLQVEPDAPLVRNETSLSFDKSHYVFSGTDTYFVMREDALTVEFFVKCPPQAKDWAPIIRANRDASEPVWAVSIGDAVSGYPLHVRCDVLTAENTRSTQNLPGLAAIADNRWHHVAFRFRPNPDDPVKSDVSVYVDYALKAERTLAGRVAHESSGAIRMGSNSGSTSCFAGLIDEVRITRGVLPVERFLRAVDIAGFRVILR